MTKSFITKKQKKSILICGVAALMTCSFCFLAACDEDSEKKEDTSTTKTDSCAITNGNFEYYTDSDNLKLIVTSPSGWTKSVGTDGSDKSASSSDAVSGIINTETAHWEDMTKSKVSQDEIKSFDDAKSKWDSMSTYDRLKFYQRIKDGEFDTKDKKYTTSDFDKYKDYTYSITIDDVPTIENPGTHEGLKTAEEGKNADEAESGILMIHNSRSDSYSTGTAQKYTSSKTITLSANTSAQVSMWVKTADLTYGDNKKEVEKDRGAYIGIKHTVGGKSLDGGDLKVTNINTKDVPNDEANNYGWEKYNFYIKACPYASTTFTVIVGLGDGSSTNSYGYVNGYAFFDDVDYKVISNADYDAATKDENQDYKVPVATINSTKSGKVFESDKEEYKDKFTYALDLYQDFHSFEIVGLYNAGDAKQNGKEVYRTIDNKKVTYEKVGEEYVISYVNEGGTTQCKTITITDLTKTIDINNNIYTTDNYKGLGIKRNDDALYTGTLSQIKNAAQTNSYLKNTLAKDFNTDATKKEDNGVYPFADNTQILMLYSVDGAAYTSTMKAANNFFTLAPKENKMISFWLKTSDLNGFTGATVTVKEGINSKTMGSYDSTTMKTIDLENEEDIYNGWAQCFIFLSNDTESDKDFYLEFSYGPTTITDTTKTSYYQGYAAFANFQYYDMDDNQFTFTGTTGNYVSVNLYGQFSNKPSENGFDTVTDSEKIETTIAAPSTYTGVKGGSNHIISGGEQCNPNDNENAGLINKSYVSAYESSSWWNTLCSIDSSITNALGNVEKWEKLFGNSSQPLLIFNAVEQAYGYYQNSPSNLSNDSYSAVSVRVKVSEGAVAYIYLIDRSNVSTGTTDALKIKTPTYTYWYDENGNVCNMDPTDKDFNKNQNIVYYLDDTNGLYYKAGDADKKEKTYYANLTNYKTEEETNNKIVDSTRSPITYKYGGDYREDYTAFYYNKDNQKYYAYHNNGEYSVEVSDFDHSIARYKNNEEISGKNDDSTSLYMVVDNRDGKYGKVSQWITCSFYLHTGNTQVSYRLEVWSGSRDGVQKSAANSFVAYEKYADSDVSSNYSKMVTEVSDSIKADGTVVTDKDTGRLVYAADGANHSKGDTYANASYYTYTFYDDIDYQRFDASLDENEKGNPYEKYSQTDKKEGLLSLYYDDSMKKTTPLMIRFVDLSLIDGSVTAESSMDEEKEEESTGWTKDMWIMLSSIILAVVLIFTMISLLIRNIIKNSSHKKGIKKNNNYSAKRKHYMRKLKLNPQEETKEENDEESSESQDNQEQTKEETDKDVTTEKDDSENPYQD